ncbi:MAG: flagellar hook-length control protein FliK [Treponema sp.]|jgi:flagellar hook-length control protein FliK|nr:flagellar hook-length control protein FliK [Treponema sp.]
MYVSPQNLQDIPRDPGGKSPSTKGVAAKSLKNDRLGVFAKLLEGLVRNPKQGPGKIEGGQDLGPKGRKHGEKKLAVALDAKAVKKAGTGPDRSKRLVGEMPVLEAGLGFATAAEPVQKAPSVSRRLDSKMQNTGPSLQNASVKTKTAVPPGETAQTGLKAEVKNGAHTGTVVAQEVLKADDRNPKGRKTAEKEGGPRITGGSAQKKDLPQVVLQGREVPGDDKTGRAKVADAKARDKRRERLGLEVQDLRSRETAAPEGELKGAGDVGPVVSAHETELLVELPSEPRTYSESDISGDKRPAQAFEDILARELHENLNGDIVRQASVVLRDDGAGTIRLSLRPESLGSVKIRLEMAENKITGHIIVESEEALRAFEREVHSLEQAFRDSGFGETSLDTALASGTGTGGEGTDWQGGGETGFFSERFVASQYALDEESGVYSEQNERGDVTGRIQQDYIPINMLA